jgi:raffinose/stachyose/melibiose transport system permease protein
MGESFKTGVKRLSSSMRFNKILTAIGSHAILIVFTVIIVYPVLWMVLASFKAPGEIVTNIWGFPRILQWTNYANAWIQADLGSALFNSTIVSLVTLILVICFASVAAYALARFSSRWLTVILLIFVFTMQTPTPIIPLYVEVAKLHLTNTQAGLILVQAAGGLPLAIFIFRAFFQGIPHELMDAANVDGCNDLQAFLRVVIPISGPAIATVGILQFVGTWNEYFLPLLLIREPAMRTIPLAIQVFFYNWGRTYWEYVFASLSIATVPIIIIYVFLARQFIQGLTAGALKG